MGNCIQKKKQIDHQPDQQQEEKKGNKNGFVKESGGVRIKVVLRKEELQLLMAQLNDEKEGRSLEDVLVEIERSRRKVDGWKPSLEKIMECPELPEMDR